MCPYCTKRSILVTILIACFNTTAKCGFICLDRVLKSNMPLLDQFDVLIVGDNSNGEKMRIYELNICIRPYCCKHVIFLCLCCICAAQNRGLNIQNSAILHWNQLMNANEVNRTHLKMHESDKLLIFFILPEIQNGSSIEVSSSYIFGFKVLLID